jgi:saccharopine dehydrogenase-like NADP-dependent oxidoreductase
MMTAMAGRIERVTVIGLGKVGELVATLLHLGGFDVVGTDTRAQAGLAFPTTTTDVRNSKDLAALLDKADAVVSCLPYHLNLAVAEAAAATETHYFDLTEDVDTTKRVRDLAAGSAVAFAPQCGLAPGLIGIVGASLTAGFEELRSIELRVGALPHNPSGQLGYAFIWSPEGVVNEYLNDCDVIRGGKEQSVPAMSGLETVVIGGIKLEAFLTSGGLGTMCETFAGRVQRLDYKTLRYPGHCELMGFFFDELHLRQRRDLAGEILVNAKPPVDDDVVYLYAAVEGRRGGEMFRSQYVRAYRPAVIDGRWWRAISWTTAASACAVVEMVASGALPGQGFLRQEHIDFDAFCATPDGARFADLTAAV